MNGTIYDADIREPLILFLEQVLGPIRTLEEKNIGDSRADLVVVTGEEVIGVEIKSDADTYARLSTQVPDYDRYFDRNLIAAGSSHASHVEEHVPEYWGIITVDPPEEPGGEVDCYLLRRPKPNPRLDLSRKLSLLWRPELNRILGRHALPAYKQKSKRFVEDKLLEKLDPETLGREIAAELMDRDYSTIAEQIRSYRAENGKKPRRKRRAAAYSRRRKKG